MFAQSIMKICGWSENILLKLHNYQTENIIILSSTETCIAQWENTWEFVSKSLNKDLQYNHLSAGNWNCMIVVNSFKNHLNIVYRFLVGDEKT